LKIASNSEIAQRKAGWIDFSAAAGAKEEDLWQLVLDVASGRKQAKNEANGFREIAIWKDGVTL
jgi:altronate hydrolase